MNALDPTRPRKDNPPLTHDLKLRLSALLVVALLAGCTRKGELDETGGVYAVRSACPQVAIPGETGTVTLFSPAGSTDSSAMDVEATITNVRVACQDTASDVVSTATFDVVATRRDRSAAREVVLPFFDVVLQGGNRVVAKHVGAVALNFAAGSLRAQTSAQATARVARSAAQLPPNVLRYLNRPRKAGDEDAAIDPLSDPSVRDAVANATFQHLVGFELTQDQLKFNATR
jgi:hypothetical protein